MAQRVVCLTQTHETALSLVPTFAEFWFMDENRNRGESTTENGANVNCVNTHVAWIEKETRSQFFILWAAEEHRAGLTLS